jgi:acyl-CoA thioesterase FadM
VITTRWMDNDPYGHMNNAVHYSLFDTAVNTWLIEQGALDFRNGSASWPGGRDWLPPLAELAILSR